MPEFVPVLVSEAEFERLQEQPAAPSGPIPVFVPPKPTDPGYPLRQKSAMAYLAKTTKIQTDAARLQLEFEARQKAAQEAGAALAVAQARLAEEAGDAADVTRAQAQVDETTAAVLAMVESLQAKLEEQMAFLDDQVTFLLPYVRGLKYPQPDGTLQVWPRPYGGDDLAQFESVARGVLGQSTQDEFTSMLRAVTGQGPSLPPTNAGR